MTGTSNQKAQGWAHFRAASRRLGLLHVSYKNTRSRACAGKCTNSPGSQPATGSVHLAMTISVLG
eukprot:scaffold6230_cov127-Isochrysis_galbana.AAC.8